MAVTNNLGSNTDTQTLARRFLKACEANRVLTKTVDVQVLAGRFSDRTGSTVYIKRPHDYKSISTSDGDISSSTKSNIEAGKAAATVQNYITVATEWSNIAECTQLDQLDKILEPMATRAVTDLELALGSFMIKNCNLSYGTPGTAIDAWTDVAGANAHLDSIGVPKDMPWNYAMNPFTNLALSNLQAGLTPGGSSNLVDTAWERSMVNKNFGGMRVFTSNALPTRTSATCADRAGALTGAPTATYVGAKDTMTQVWAVTGFTASATLKAGDILEVTGRYRLSHATREPIFDASAAKVKFRATITEDVTLGSSGEGNVTVAGAAIYEATGAYNTVDSALTTSDVVTLLGTTGAVYQPALFYHPQAFAMTTLKIPKLAATDTTAVAKDGFSFRVTRYSDGDKNLQKVRFDILPAFAALNPFFAGQAYGV